MVTRAIAVIDERGNPQLWSRNGLTLEIKFPGVLKAVRKLKLRSTILDGEIVAIDDEGIPRFQLLQKWQKQASAPLAYYLFDLLWAEGMDVTAERILERRRRLNEIVSEVPGIQLGGYMEGFGKELFRVAKDKGMEGIVAKRKDSIYQPGRRTSDWLKIKARLQQEFVVGEFSEGKGSRKNLGALLLEALPQRQATLLRSLGKRLYRERDSGRAQTNETAFYRQIALRKSAKGPGKDPVGQTKACLRGHIRQMRVLERSV